MSTIDAEAKRIYDALGRGEPADVKTIKAALLAAERRGKDEERERWKPAAVYFEHYCQDEAAELECCVSEKQHLDAKAFAAAIRGS